MSSFVLGRHKHTLLWSGQCLTSIARNADPVLQGERNDRNNLTFAELSIPQTRLMKPLPHHKEKYPGRVCFSFQHPVTNLECDAQ